MLQLTSFPDSPDPNRLTAGWPTSVNSVPYLKRDLVQNDGFYKCLEDGKDETCQEIEDYDGSVVWHSPPPEPTPASAQADYQSVTDKYTAEPGGSFITVSIPAQTQPPVVK